MSRGCLPAIFLLFLSGCSGVLVRVVDETTGQPIQGTRVSATPTGIFLLGMPASDEALTDENGLVALRNRRIDASRISVDGMDSILRVDDIVKSTDRTSNGAIRVEHVGSTIGWPFRGSNTVAR
jgi:hypothetical protein